MKFVAGRFFTHQLVMGTRGVHFSFSFEASLFLSLFVGSIQAEKLFVLWCSQIKFQVVLRMFSMVSTDERCKRDVKTFSQRQHLQTKNDDESKIAANYYCIHFFAFQLYLKTICLRR